VTAVLEARGLGKRYGRRWALTDCTLEIPSGHVVGLVGPNGAGKTTLLHLAVGLLAPTSGSIEVLNGGPRGGEAQLRRIGFVAQDTPTYAGLSVADHLRLGARLNPGWDAQLAEHRIERLGSTPASAPGSSPAANAPSLRSRWRSPSAPNSSSSTNPSPRSTRWRAATSSRCSWESSRRTV